MRCLLSFNLSRLQPVLTGAITKMVCLGICCFVTLLTALLAFAHLCYTFSITFAPSSVACSVQPNVLGLKVQYGFHLTHLSGMPLFSLHGAGGEDELRSNVNSFILSLFSAYMCKYVMTSYY